MDLQRKKYTTKVLGEEVTLEISDLAVQANAAVLGTLGDTTVLATVVMGKEDKMGSYFPLTVDYEERFYAAGKIIGSRFIRREGRPSDEAILSCRLIDRVIRPLFDHRLRREVQVTVTVLSYDEKNDPDVIAMLAVSTALSISDIPWGGPTAGVRFVSELGAKKPYLGFFAGPRDLINMIEFEGSEIPHSFLKDLYTKASETVNALIDFQESIVKTIGKKKTEITLPEPDVALQKEVREFVEPRLLSSFQTKTYDVLTKELFAHFEGRDPIVNPSLISLAFENFVDAFVHDLILKKEKRVDGRALDEVRGLSAEVQLFRRTHGSGLFMRGTTQVLALTTLAAPSAEQLIETMETTGKKRFLLHYNFPSFSVGEVGRSRGPGRREIGHGALAAKAITHLIPPKAQFPYTIRVVAETLSSNGSSSMASTCAASLSLMDAGVPLPKHVAGISVGLAMDPNGKAFKLLTDIQGPEDHHCDMDFKVAGTIDGVTAIQLDTKVRGITKEIFEGAIERAHQAREKILKVMEKTLPSYRKELSPFAPKIMTLQILPEKIGLVIGSGGKTINSIIALAKNEVSIDIEEDGMIFFCGTNLELVKQAYTMVEQIVRDYVVGEIVEGTIIKVLDFGAIVDLGGGRDGMIHVSELKEGFVKNVQDVVKVGDFVRVKVTKVDSDGRIGLSLKAMQ